MTEPQITATPDAAAYIRSQLRSQQAAAIRVGVKTDGCSGYSYVLDFAHQPEPHDLEFHSNGVTILVDPVSIQVLAGSELVFQRQGLNSTIEVHNPNAMATCGCGESFALNAP